MKLFLKLNSILTVFLLIPVNKLSDECKCHAQTKKCVGECENNKNQSCETDLFCQVFILIWIFLQRIFIKYLQPS